MELARQHVESLESEFKRKRATSILFVAMSTIISYLFYYGDLPMISFCILIVAMMFVLRCVDADSQLRMIRLYSKNTLVSRVGILEPGESTSKTAGSSRAT
jgi:hypothetical protein